MFSNSSKNIDVSIRMLDGAVIRGAILQGHASSLEGVLSKETPFLEFVSRDGQRKFIAKHQIAYVEPVEPLRKPVLVSPSDPRYVDCYGILGLERGCSFDAAKEAYHRLAKQYHPDSYSGLALPAEVERYLTDMFRQINTAFTEVRSETQQRAA
ncbi:MAG: J domain-containing protein [Nitratireductor sp.]